MASFTIILIVVSIVLALMAFKFLVGLVRTVVSVALLIIAAVLLISLLTGNDLLGVGQSVANVKGAVNDTMTAVQQPINDTIQLVTNLDSVPAS